MCIDESGETVEISDLLNLLVVIIINLSRKIRTIFIILAHNLKNKNNIE